MPPPKQVSEEQLSSDPDNIPPRSRLFIVVPKTAEVRLIQVCDSSCGLQAKIVSSSPGMMQLHARCLQCSKQRHVGAECLAWGGISCTCMSRLSEPFFPALQEEVSRFPDLEYCKTDLISAKGVVFCKFSKASSALRSMEDVCNKGMVGAAALVSGSEVDCPGCHMQTEGLELGA